MATTTSDKHIGRFIEIDGVIVHYVAPLIPGGSLFYFTKMPVFSSRAYTFVNKLCRRECVVHSVYFYNVIKGDYRNMPLVITEFEHYPWIREYMYHYPFISTYARLRWEIDASLRIQLARLLMPRAKLLTSASELQKKSTLSPHTQYM